jgi:hypothetical protein
MTDDEVWDRFTIRAYRDSAGAGAIRVEFEPKDPAARGRPAVVVLRGGGELLVRCDPPEPAVPGLGRHDFLKKAVSVVRELERE